MKILELLENQYFGNSLRTLLIALGIAIAIYVVINMIRKVLMNNFARLAKKTENAIDDMIVSVIGQTKQLFLLVETIFIGSMSLVIPTDIATWSRGIATIALFIQIGFWVAKICEFYINRQENKNVRNLFNMVVKVILWILILLWALENLGVEVSALVASLGITGIVIGLALQNILGDLFSAFSITIDKPFEVGDYIVIGEQKGTVERLGWKSTRIRSISGEMLVVGNTDLLSSRIQNYKHLQRRRVDFTFGVIYQTTYDQLKQIGQIVGDYISSLEKVTFDRVHLKQLGESSIDFEVVYYMETPDNILYLDAQESINFELFRRFEELGIGFAYPAQTIHLIND